MPNSALSYLTVRPPEPLSYGAPTVDFSPIGNLAKTYQETQARDIETRLKGADLAEQQEYLRRAGIAMPQQQGLLGNLLGLGGTSATNAAQPAQPVQQPPGSIGTNPYIQPPQRSGQPQPQAGQPAATDNQGYDTVRSLTPYDPEDPSGGVPQPVMDKVALRVGARPSGDMTAADVPLTPGQMTKALQIIADEKIGQRQGGQPTTARTAQVAPETDPRIRSLDQAINRMQQELEGATLGRSPGAQRLYEAKREQLKTVQERRNQLYDRLSGEYEKGLAPGFESATTTARRINEARANRVAEATTLGGRDSQNKLVGLNIISSALSHGGTDIPAGPASGIWRTVLQGMQTLFPGREIAGLPESEVIAQFNTALVGQAQEEMRKRGMSFNINPTMLTSLTGTKMIVDILKQTTEDDLNLAREASKIDPTNPQAVARWQQIEDNYYRKHPIKSPFTEATTEPAQPAQPAQPLPPGQRAAPVSRTGPLPPGKYLWTPGGGVQAQ